MAPSPFGGTPVGAGSAGPGLPGLGAGRGCAPGRLASPAQPEHYGRQARGKDGPWRQPDEIAFGHRTPVRRPLLSADS